MTDLLKFILHGEGLKLKAYKCPAGVWTIGMGSTYYVGGKPVKEGDTITESEAETLASVQLEGFANHVKNSVTAMLSDNQWIALTSFCYNIGKAGFSKSQILKMVNANPNDPAIKARFLISFITAAGLPCKGLVNIRQSEATQYFK